METLSKAVYRFLEMSYISQAELIRKLGLKFKVHLIGEKRDIYMAKVFNQVKKQGLVDKFIKETLGVSEKEKPVKKKKEEIKMKDFQLGSRSIKNSERINKGKDRAFEDAVKFLKTQYLSLLDIALYADAEIILSLKVRG